MEIKSDENRAGMIEKFENSIINLAAIPIVYGASYYFAFLLMIDSSLFNLVSIEDMAKAGIKMAVTFDLILLFMFWMTSKTDLWVSIIQLPKKMLIVSSLVMIIILSIISYVFSLFPPDGSFGGKSFFIRNMISSLLGNIITIFTAIIILNLRYLLLELYLMTIVIGVSFGITEFYRTVAGGSQEALKKTYELCTGQCKNFSYIVSLTNYLIALNASDNFTVIPVAQIKSINVRLLGATPLSRTH